MNSVIKSLLVLITITMLAACGTTQVALQPGAAANIHNISLIRVEEPATYIGSDFGNPASAFGAVGGAIAGASSAKAGTSVNQIALGKSVKAGERLTQLLADKLTSNGFNVTLITVPRDKKTKLLNTYNTVDSGEADAILDIVIESIGYATEHSMTSPFWRPSSQIKVALVKSSNQKIIYSEKFMYGYHNPFISGTDIDAPEKFRFKNKEELFADADQLADGLRDSVDAIAKQIAGKLKK